ncbi:hypothetical protein ACTXT7_009267 [Hymenolepis weldensis]
MSSTWDISIAPNFEGQAYRRIDESISRLIDKKPRAAYIRIWMRLTSRLETVRRQLCFACPKAYIRWFRVIKVYYVDDRSQLEADNWVSMRGLRMSCQ